MALRRGCVPVLAGGSQVWPGTKPTMARRGSGPVTPRGWKPVYGRGRPWKSALISHVYSAQHKPLESLDPANRAKILNCVLRAIQRTAHAHARTKALGANYAGRLCEDLNLRQRRRALGWPAELGCLLKPKCDADERRLVPRPPKELDANRNANRCAVSRGRKTTRHCNSREACCRAEHAISVGLPGSNRHHQALLVRVN